jgi:catechol 2,3-dioxygenase-like lactoylglutathione lyase family enzyme
MNVIGITWMGVQTDRFNEMTTFMQAVIGAPPSGTEPGFALWRLPNGDLVEIFADRDKPTFGTAPVVGFQVADLALATRDIEDAGAEIVSRYGPNEAGYEAVHFRAPDGNIYEIVHDPDRDGR